VKGQVQILFKSGNNKLEHLGIKIELVGVIENLFDKTQTTKFLSLMRDLEPPGTLTDSGTYDFSFNSVEKQYETYNGIVVRVRYFINVIINRNYNRITREEEFIVYNPGAEPEHHKPIKNEVGIDGVLHIEFEFRREQYHLKDCVYGSIHFNQVRIKIKHMQLDVMKKELVGTGQNQLTETETVCKFEVMDGAPVKGEVIPVRLFLASADLTPTYLNVNNRFSVKYFLNLVLIDEEDRRYFKQVEVQLWRKQF